MQSAEIKLLYISLGCDKNRVDSEYMLGTILSHGVTLTDDEAEADVIVINSCCFIGDAKEESIDTILEMARMKEEGRCRSLIVTGCLAQRYSEEIKEEIPEVDAIMGTNSGTAIWEAITETLSGRFFEDIAPLLGFSDFSAGRVVTTGGHYAYLKIAEGCDKRCTYCVIPSVRGSYRSVPMGKIVESAKRLVEGGAKELILVAQETTMYGVDLYGEKSLHLLLDELNAIPGLIWIRIMYCYPEEIYDGLIDAMTRDKKVCHYLDIPIQHCNDDILRKMGRRTNKAQLTERIAMLRDRLPDIALRTTIICGFPGETDEAHEELMQFVNDMEFDRLGAFGYSQEEDTPAAEFPDQVPEETKEAWRADVMEL
ncbi:MAG: 30S ribosomal protein S12 methylthiotransferase RimO, partial [Clostridiales bacterium]|nr:30S ribosomal protein S12 methylthiotransferase RimO [Clostridiales bacterium]